MHCFNLLNLNLLSYFCMTCRILKCEAATLVSLQMGQVLVALIQTITVHCSVMEKLLWIYQMCSDIRKKAAILLQHHFLLFLVVYLLVIEVTHLTTTPAMVDLAAVLIEPQTMLSVQTAC